MNMYTRALLVIEMMRVAELSLTKGIFTWYKWPYLNKYNSKD